MRCKQNAIKFAAIRETFLFFFTIYIGSSGNIEGIFFSVFIELFRKRHPRGRI